MSLGKKDIATNIASKAQISNKISKKLIDSFISIIKEHSEYKDIKISNFGTFKRSSTPQRIGRNRWRKSPRASSKDRSPTFRTAGIFASFMATTRKPKKSPLPIRGVKDTATTTATLMFIRRSHSEPMIITSQYTKRGYKMLPGVTIMLLSNVD